MERLIKEANSYVIQERFLWFWVDKSAQDDAGNNLPCIYMFDTLKEALRYCNSECLIEKKILLEEMQKNKNYIKSGFKYD